MKNRLISVIIPVYNVREYLEKCVNSVITQNYKNLEIILINDGSTDDSGEICEELGEQHRRISIIHQENGGLSDARNTGTKAAKGDYVFYLDSDDYITSECLDTLYNAIIKYNAEIAQANFYYDYPNHLLFDNCLEGKDQVYSRDEAMQLLLKQVIIKNFAWGKLIRADIAKKHLFPKGKYFEDTFWKYHIIHECKKYVALAQPMLFYLQRTDSISGSFSLRSLHQLEGEALRIDFLKQYYPDLICLAKKSLKIKLQQYRGHLNHLDFEDQILLLKTIEGYEITYKIQNDTDRVNIYKLFSRISNRLFRKKQYVKIDKT